MRKYPISYGRYAEQLRQELEEYDFLSRLSQISQLGRMRVKKKHKKSREDYLNLQLHIHEVLKKRIDEKLTFTYNSKLKLEISKKDMIENKAPSVWDCVQIMALVSNIGHTQNTFAASIGILLACKKDEEVKETFLANYQETDSREIAEQIIDTQNYRHFPMCVALMMLERCKELPSVKVAKELIKKYFLRSDEGNEKLEFAFDLFKDVRNFTFYAFDLPVSKLPFRIEYTDDDAICEVFEEIQGKYNDNTPAKNLFQSIVKLLDDTVYNVPKDTIIRYRRTSKKIQKSLQNGALEKTDFLDMVLQEGSIFNQPYRQRKGDMDEENILKLTVSTKEVEFDKLLERMEHTQFVRTAYYDRENDQKSILVALSKKVTLYHAFCILKILIRYTIYTGKEEHPGLPTEDKQFIRIAKFFLYHLFNKRTVMIDETKGVDVYVARGKAKRMEPLKKVITGDTSDDEEHELSVILTYLKRDSKNDTAIVIGGSTRVLRNENEKEKEIQNELSEYDGIIIYPNRTEKQIVFLEAKNRKRNRKEAKKALQEKFRNAGIVYEENEFIEDGNDCWYEYTIKRRIQGE